jgi:ribosomal protein S27E
MSVAKRMVEEELDADERRREAAYKTHPGFQVICEQCGSDLVIAENDVGFSEASGAWGGVYLTCQGCENTATLYG